MVSPTHAVAPPTFQRCRDVAAATVEHFAIELGARLISGNVAIIPQSLTFADIVSERSDRHTQTEHPRTARKRRLPSCDPERHKPHMEYRRLPLLCECGVLAAEISTVGLSSTHELVVEWQCPLCHRNRYMVKPLSDCWRDCFDVAASGNQNSPSTKPPMDTPDDRRFLHNLGVRYLDE